MEVASGKLCPYTKQICCQTTSTLDRLNTPDMELQMPLGLLDKSVYIGLNRHVLSLDERPRAKRFLGRLMLDMVVWR